MDGASPATPRACAQDASDGTCSPVHNLTNPLRFLVMATSLVRLLASWSVNTRSTSKKAQYNAAFAAEMAANETSMQRLEEELTLLLGLPPSGKKKVRLVIDPSHGVSCDPPHLEVPGLNDSIDLPACKLPTCLERTTPHRGVARHERCSDPSSCRELYGIYVNPLCASWCIGPQVNSTLL